MAEKKEKTRDEVIADWVTAEKAKQRTNRKKRRLDESEATVTINSLMDAMTIILIFLLMNYSMDPLRVDSSKDLKLPISTTEQLPKKTIALTISAKAIMLDGKQIVEVKEGAVSKIDKGGEENSMLIQPLLTALTTAANTQKEIDRRMGAKFDGMITFITHDDTPYSLLRDCMYTATNAEFKKFKFAVSKGGRRGFHPPGGGEKKGLF
jgi:biopolymer transport protein ExbD